MKDIISILPGGRGSHLTEMYENISNICFNVNHLNTLSYMFKNDNFTFEIDDNETQIILQFYKYSYW